MKLIDGLLDYSTKWILPNVYLFTGNAMIKNNGAIVMGRGAAKQVRDSYPGVDKQLGSIIKKHDDTNVLWTVVEKGQFLGWFKVKNHWRENAKLDIIKNSVVRLSIIAIDRPEMTFHMNYPGIGNGKLDIESVQELIEVLPNNVWIYK